MIHLLKEKINMFFVFLLSSHTSSQGCRLWGKNRGKSLKQSKKSGTQPSTYYSWVGPDSNLLPSWYLRVWTELGNILVGCLYETKGISQWFLHKECNCYKGFWDFSIVYFAQRDSETVRKKKKDNQINETWRHEENSGVNDQI